MIGTYKKLASLDIKLGELKADLEVLEKYGAEDTYDRCRASISLVEEQIQLLNNRAIFCPKCGHLLNKEERIYARLSGFDWDGPVYCSLWDTYICPNCGFFTWDEESRRNLGGRSSALMRDPRYRGTMDGHPKHDVDNERWR